MRENQNIWLVLADTGYGVLDKIREEFPERVINCGAAEQLMIGTAVGLAQEGKIPICYTITPFLLNRPFEFIRNYINYEKVPVILVGSGRDKDYDKDGFTHWSEDDFDIMKIFNNIQTVYPETKESIYFVLDKVIKSQKPYYINLKRRA